MANKIIYYVIKFENRRAEYFNKYVCVPSFWVLSEDDDGRITFRYPKGKMYLINKRLRDGHSVSEKWPIHLETVKDKSYNLNNANQKMLNLRLQEEEFNDTGKAPAAAKAKKRKLTNEKNDERPNLGNDNSMKKHRVDENADRCASTSGQTPNNHSTSWRDSNAASTAIQDLLREIKGMRDDIKRFRQAKDDSTNSPPGTRRAYQ